MISPTLDSLRVILHLLGVAVWVGGQIVLAGLVPSVRKEAPQALASVARAFSRIAWPAMMLIILTGAWGLAEKDVADRQTDYLVTLALKLMAVGIAVAATIVHSVGTSKLSKALGGALGLLGSLFAAYCGVLLAHVG